MELQFGKNLCGCLQQVCHQDQTQEQTEEVRLSDDMPDIGRVLGAWGQVLLRSKEWRSNGAAMNCGVMAWVLYEPDGGGTPVCVETWIPFQMKWDLQDAQTEGSIHGSCLLHSMDARSTSARKLMIRATVSVLADVMVPHQAELYAPEENPKDVQMLKNTYPVQLPKEAGEKAFDVEEIFSFPASCPKLGKLIRYGLQPEVQDQKVMTDKVVFRGTAIVHVLYCSEDGSFYSWDFELPFSQYTELDHEYDHEATARIGLELTSLELEPDEEGQLHMKAGMVGQYVIYDRQMLEVVEDAYSPVRKVVPKVAHMQMPVVLDMQSQIIAAEHTLQAEGTRLIDLAFYPDQAKVHSQADQAEVELPGWFQMLYYDLEGTLQCSSSRWDSTWCIGAAEDCRVQAVVAPVGKAQGNLSGGSAGLRADVLVNTITTARQGIPVVTGLELGEEKQPDPDRPSLILRRVGDASLWQMAKETGSTVEAIREANGLQDDPDPMQILLIPVS